MSRHVSVIPLCGGALVLAGATLLGAQATPTYDLILRHGTIVDGSGAPRITGDVAVAGDAIVAVGDLGGATAGTEVDATGLVVAPGFINIHSHPTPEGLRTARNMLTQGVTTEILNPDGGGPVDVGAQLDTLAGAGLAVNAGANIGFNSIWAQVVGQADRRPGRDEIEQMKTLVLAGLQAGAWGVSAGLDYKPGYFATTEEVTGIVKAAAPWRTIFTNHDRLTPESGYSSRVGIAETLAVGERAGLVPVVTHMKAQGREQKTGAALVDLLARMTARGRYAAADAYPYLAGQSGLGALIIPGWAQDGGREKMLERFQDPALRKKIVAESEEAMNARFGGPEGGFVTGLDRELTDIMREMGSVSPGEALVRTLEEANRGAILRFGAEEDLVAILKAPATSIACDCGAVDGRASHPRYYGTFPRVLGRYVRDEHVLTLEDAVRKMSGLPATTIGLVDRGFLAPGMKADIAVFDPATIIDHATFEKPTEVSDGVRHVLVNGRFALRDGQVTGEQAGRALRRDAHMPSRPMGNGQARAVQAAGTVGATDGPRFRVTIDVRQGAADRAARGTLRLTAPQHTVEIVSLGLLQTAPRWASLGATARIDGTLCAITVIVDRANPTAPSIMVIGGRV